MIGKLLLSVVGLICLIDIIINLLSSRNAGDFATELCRPFFGIFYPKIGMFYGLILWLVEFAITISSIWVWF